MDNSTKLEGLNEKTGDLLNMAKDFCKDAERLEKVMADRNKRMKFIMFSSGTGGAGVIGLPILMCLI